MQTSTSSSDVNWEEKYHNIKKRYQNLVDVRKTSAKNDCIELQNIINQHQVVHNSCVQELKRQNEDLEIVYKDIQNGEQRNEKRLLSIKKLEEEISSKDHTIGMILKFPSLSVQYLEKHKYKVRAGKSLGFIFKLTFRGISENSYDYIPESCPSSAPPEFSTHGIIKAPYLEKTLHQIEQYVQTNSF